MELGSEFYLSLSNLNVKENNVIDYFSAFPETYYFDSGRAAIKYLASHLAEQDKVLLPEFICDSVINCFKKENIIFYSINTNCQIDVDDLKFKIAKDVKVLFLAHYFGCTQKSNTIKEIKRLAKENSFIVVEDVTQNLFSEHNYAGDYVVSSVRKWVPVPGCGTLSVINNKLKIEAPNFPKSIDNTRASGMILKDLFINNKLNCNKEYRTIFAEAEERLNTRNEIFMMSDLSAFLLKCFDVREIIKARKNNYIYLENKICYLGLSPIVELSDKECPFAFVIRINNRDDFRRYLIENNIYCAVHWPYDGILPEQRPTSVFNSKTLLSLPIDQRYNTEHMDYLINTISKYRGDLTF